MWQVDVSFGANFYKQTQFDSLDTYCTVWLENMQMRRTICISVYVCHTYTNIKSFYLGVSFRFIVNYFILVSQISTVLLTIGNAGGKVSKKLFGMPIGN